MVDFNSITFCICIVFAKRFSWHGMGFRMINVCTNKLCMGCSSFHDDNIGANMVSAQSDNIKHFIVSM